MIGQSAARPVRDRAAGAATEPVTDAADPRPSRWQDRARRALRLLSLTPRYLLIWLLRGYQLLISPLLGPVCRFAPSCSSYAVEAVRTFGAVRGGWLAGRRVLRCHPWSAGGWDPVPPRDARGGSARRDDAEHR